MMFKLSIYYNFIDVHYEKSTWSVYIVIVHDCWELNKDKYLVFFLQNNAIL